MKKEKIAVLIPCYNEAKTIEKVVKDYKKALPDATIYVFDNNSIDSTDEIAKKAAALIKSGDTVIMDASTTVFRICHYIKGIKNLVSFGFSVGDAVKCASANPAELMHYKNKGMLIPGYDADIAVFDKHFNVLLTAVNGNIKKNIL